MSRYDQNCKTELGLQSWDLNGRVFLSKPAQTQRSRLLCGTTHCNSSVLVLALTCIHSSRLEPLLTLPEYHHQRLNVEHPMAETQCQRLHVRAGFDNLVTCLCFTSQLSIQFDIHVHRDSSFTVFSFPSLDCCKAFSESRPATHSINVLGRHALHRGTDFFGPVRKASRPSPLHSK